MLHAVRVLALGVVVSLTATTTVHAYFTGNDFRALCKEHGERDGSSARQICITYVAGFRDALDIVRGGLVGVFGEERVPEVMGYCTPENGLQAEQAFAVIMKFMDEHPSLWHQPMSGLAYRALADAFQCSSE